MRVLLKRPGQVGVIGELNGYQEMHDFVGGFIETVRINRNTVIVCNDNFLNEDFSFNMGIAGTIFFGNIFLCGIDIVNSSGEWDLIGLTDEQLQTDLVRFIMGELQEVDI